MIATVNTGSLIGKLTSNPNHDVYLLYEWPRTSILTGETDFQAWNYRRLALFIWPLSCKTNAGLLCFSRETLNNNTQKKIKLIIATVKLQRSVCLEEDRVTMWMSLQAISMRWYLKLPYLLLCILTTYIEGYMLCINLSYFMSTLLLISGIRNIIEKKKKKSCMWTVILRKLNTKSLTARRTMSWWVIWWPSCIASQTWKVSAMTAFRKHCLTKLLKVLKMMISSKNSKMSPLTYSSRNATA